LETQLAVFGGSPSVAEQSLAMDRLAEAMRAQGVKDAPEVRRLPELITRAELAWSVPGVAGIGVVDDTLTSVGIAPEGAFMVSGPPSSGRSTALQLLVQATQAALPKAKLYYIGNARSPLRSAADWASTASG